MKNWNSELRLTETFVFGKYLTWASPRWRDVWSEWSTSSMVIIAFFVNDKGDEAWVKIIMAYAHEEISFGKDSTFIVFDWLVELVMELKKIMIVLCWWAVVVILLSLFVVFHYIVQWAKTLFKVPLISLTKSTMTDIVYFWSTPWWYNWQICSSLDLLAFFVYLNFRTVSCDLYMMMIGWKTWTPAIRQVSAYLIVGSKPHVTYINTTEMEIKYDSKKTGANNFQE